MSLDAQGPADARVKKSLSVYMLCIALLLIVAATPPVLLTRLQDCCQLSLSSAKGPASMDYNQIWPSDTS